MMDFPDLTAVGLISPGSTGHRMSKLLGTLPFSFPFNSPVSAIPCLRRARRATPSGLSVLVATAIAVVGCGQSEAPLGSVRQPSVDRTPTLSFDIIPISRT